MIIQNKSRIQISLPWLKKKLAQIIRATKVPEIDLDLTLVSDPFIKKLNAQYRKKNKPTDVLSFPLHEKKKARKGSVFLGDVIISLPTARKQAKEHDVDFKEELLFLIIHGTLHLLAYDHEKSEKEAKIMQRLEKEILQKVL